MNLHESKDEVVLVEGVDMKNATPWKKRPANLHHGDSEDKARKKPPKRAKDYQSVNSFHIKVAAAQHKQTPKKYQLACLGCHACLSLCLCVSSASWKTLW